MLNFNSNITYKAPKNEKWNNFKSYLFYCK